MQPGTIREKTGRLQLCQLGSRLTISRHIFWMLTCGSFLPVRWVSCILAVLAWREVTWAVPI